MMKCVDIITNPTAYPVTVAIDEPAMPILKAPINRKSSPRFTAFATITMFDANAGLASALTK